MGTVAAAGSRRIYLRDSGEVASKELRPALVATATPTAESLSPRGLRGEGKYLGASGTLQLVGRSNGEAGTSIFRSGAFVDCDDISGPLPHPLQHTSFPPHDLTHPADCHIDDLEGGWRLVFAPRGGLGPVVLNPPAFALWNRFKHSGFASLSARQTARAPLEGWVPDADTSSVLQRMVEVGILESRYQDTGRLPQGRAQVLGAWLQLTDACNLRCDYCYVEKSAHFMSRATGREAVDGLCRTALEGGFRAVRVKFAGGEPTLASARLLELDAYARQRTAELGLEYGAVVLTNGVRLRSEFIAAARERGLQVTVSLDAIDQAHDQQRRFLSGGGSGQRVRQGIEQLLAEGLRPFVTVTVTSRNVASLPQTARFLLERELPFNLNFVRDSRAAVASGNVLRASEAALIEALHRTCDEVEARMPAHSVLGMLIDRANFGHPHAKPCGMGAGYMAVDHAGRVAACHMAMHEAVTHVRERRALAILQEHVTAERNVAVDDKPTCSTCQWRYGCAGGCPQLTYQVTGRSDVQSPYCNVYRAIYPRLLRLEGQRLLRWAQSSQASQPCS